MLNIKGYIESRLVGANSGSLEYRIARGAKLYSELSLDLVYELAYPNFDFDEYRKNRSWKHYSIPVTDVTNRLISEIICKYLDIKYFELYRGINLIKSLGYCCDEYSNLIAFNMPPTNLVMCSLHANGGIDTDGDAPVSFKTLKYLKKLKERINRKNK